MTLSLKNDIIKYNSKLNEKGGVAEIMTITEDDVTLIFKFGEKRWIEKLVEGEISFSCAGSFISQAKHSKNQVQGDKYEAVFAKLIKSDPRINQMRLRLKNDLEEIEEGDFVYLRRKSAKLKPIFCVYSYKIEDAEADALSHKPGRQIIRHKFNPQMYNGFGSFSARNVLREECRPVFAMFKADTFSKKIKQITGCEVKHINYMDIVPGFFVEPTNEYPELFIKSKNYQDQKETRVCLPDRKLCSIADRYNVRVSRFFPGENVEIFSQASQIEFSVVFSREGKIISL